VQSLQQSSEEAWVKLYKRDSQSDNQQLSYYLKGQLVALLLDLHLLSIGSDLTDLLGNLWRCFGALERGYSQADLLAATADLAPDLGPLLQHWLTSVDELPLESYLRKAGMRLIPEHPSSPHTGLLLETVQGQVKVRRVERHSPGEQAGLSPGDELLALDGERLRQGEQLDLWLRSGVQHRLLFCRDAAVHECCLYPAVARPRHWQLQSDPSASVVACQLRHRWLWRKKS
jgi:predicted metalloprotease with PDZ domain